MPFDGTNFPQRPNKPPPLTRREKLFVTAAVVLTLLMMLMPITPGGFVALVHFLGG